MRPSALFPACSLALVALLLGPDPLGQGQGRRAGRRQAPPPKPTHGLVVRPPQPLQCKGTVGGTFLPAEKTFLLGNAGLEPLTWSAQTTADWVTVEPAEGTLEPGTRSNVRVVIEAEEVSRLMPGNYPALVQFANDTDGRGTTTREVQLSIRAPPGLSITPTAPFEVTLAADSPFSARSRVYALDNRTARPIPWSVRADQPWLRADPARGELAPGTSALVRVSIDQERAPGEAGEHIGLLHFQNDLVQDAAVTPLVREVELRVGSQVGLVVTPFEDVALDSVAEESVVRRSYTLRNQGSLPLGWQAEIAGEGISVSKKSGELEPGATTVVEVEIESSAVRGAIVFVNSTDGMGTTTCRIEPADERDRAPLTTSSVSQFGVTWTFDRDVEVGRFANGDYWVVGPVAVVRIEPRARRVGKRTINGSMLNPSPRGPGQGYDSAMFGKYRSSGSYRERLNVGLDVSPARPLVLAPHSSLVSSTSVPTGGARPQLDTAAILTVLAEPAPEGSFRPPYCGTDKTPRHKVDDLDRGLLQRLAPVPSTPSIRRVASNFERPWLDHIQDWVGRYHHPVQNMPDYGREISEEVGTAALMLHLDLPLEEKEELLVRFVQVGIDFFGIVQDGGHNNWPAGGGHHSGRKWPILFAGLMLGDPAMTGIGELDVAFNEDDQTFYVEETSPGVYNEGHGGYGPQHVGLPEWGNQHAKNRGHDDVRWTDEDGSNTHLGYRICCTANVWWGSVLAARIMGAQGLWNHDALFDYMDRYREVSRTAGLPGWTLAWKPFALEMWDRHRADY